MTALAPREGYCLWATAYEAENAVTRLEHALVAQLGPSPQRLRLLDAGCGTGRRLARTGAARAAGVDLSPEMLAEGRRNPALADVELIEGDVRALPFADSSFDLVWCRLVIGHLPRPGPAYAELARVAAPGATVIVTDFHPAAYAAGHRRTFRLAEQIHELIHYPHPAHAQIKAAQRAGLAFRTQSEAAIGAEVRSCYEAAGRLALYHRHRGLPVVLALAFMR
jgi:malonyl-CoA O-methyltransferase